MQYIKTDEVGCSSPTLYYEDRFNRKVTFVGSMHVADSDFYTHVQSEIDRHERGLYEELKPLSSHEGLPVSRIPRIDIRSVTIRRDETLAKYLGLVTERDSLNFGSGWRNCDIGIYDILKDGSLSLIRHMSEGVAAQCDFLDEHFAKIYLSDPLHVQRTFKQYYLDSMKRHTKRFFPDRIKSIEGFEELIIKRRNELLLNELKKTLESGINEVGIVYGAAHIPELDLKIRQIGFKRRKISWIDVFTLRKRIDVNSLVIPYR